MVANDNRKMTIHGILKKFLIA